MNKKQERSKFREDSNSRLAMDLYHDLKKVLITFPIEEAGNLNNQLRRASSSVAKHISVAEKAVNGNKGNAYSISIGSAQEVIGGLHIAHHFDYISKEMYNYFTREYQFMITGMLPLVEKWVNPEKIEIRNVYDFRDDQIFKDSLSLVIQAYEYTQAHLGSDDNDEALQLRKHATSVVLNISESFQAYIGKQSSYLNNAYHSLQKFKTSVELLNIESFMSQKLLSLAKVIEKQFAEVIIKEDVSQW